MKILLNITATLVLACSLQAQVSFTLSSTAGVGSGPQSVTAADLNGDGKLELVCANQGSGTLSVLTNNGSGGFATAGAFNVGNQPLSVTAADMNGDGKLDLISANYGDNTLSVLTNNGSGGFVLAGTYAVVGGQHPYSVVAADVNGDGKLDLICAESFGDTICVLTNNGSGGFVTAGTYPVGSNPLVVTAADVNGDGKPDFISANFYANTLSVYTNNGSGGFALAEAVATSGPYSVTVADVNGDGKPDLISANYYANALSIYTNNGNGGFVFAGTYAVGQGPEWVTTADVNGDGKPDLISANTYGNTLSVLTNNGTGGFVLAGTYTVGQNPASVTTADVNGDGKPDLISGNFSGNTLSVLTNGTPFSPPPIPPAIINQPTNQFLTVGDSISFSVTANGTSPLSYQWSLNMTNIDGATNAILTLNDVQMSDAGYYTVTVTNLYGSTTSSNALLNVNQSPVADASATMTPVISTNGSDAAVVLNGTLSYDPDGDSLQYTWYQTGSPDPLATGVIDTVVLPVGNNSITLVVSDGLASSQQSVLVDVITIPQAVEQLQTMVLTKVAKPQPLMATLNAALGSINRSNSTAAINQLQTFQNKVAAQVSPKDAALAQTLTYEAQNIINVLSGK
jgi:hypothetical protein